MFSEMEIDMHLSMLRRRLAIGFTLAVFLVAGSFATAGQNAAPAQAQPAISGDAALAKDNPQGGASSFFAHADEADLVADVVLIKGFTHVPAPLRTIVTDYVFEVREM